MAAYAGLNLAAANGEDNAVKERDAFQKRMSLQQVTYAQKRTKELKQLIAEKKAEAKSGTTVER